MPELYQGQVDALFLGKKTIFIFSNVSSKSSGWHGALSMNRILLLFSWLSFFVEFR